MTPLVNQYHPQDTRQQIDALAKSATQSQWDRPPHVFDGKLRCEHAFHDGNLLAKVKEELAHKREVPKIELERPGLSRIAR